MRHIVNFGLLFSFSTLAVTGVLAFVKPFSLMTTRIHIVFGLATAILVVLHLVDRIKYFQFQLFRRPATENRGRRIARLSIGAVVLVWAGLLSSAVFNWVPVGLLIDLGYESQHRLEIVRSSMDSAYFEQDHERFVLRRPGKVDDSTGRANLSLKIQFSNNLDPKPTIAVWTETTVGAMIETIYLDPSIAYSERPNWFGTDTDRKEILPIWRHRYTLYSGVDPEGKIDAFSGATASHSFTLDDYLELGTAMEFVLCVEVNQTADPNEFYLDPIVGQPSLLYTALIELDSAQRYRVLELTGHGGGAEKSGAIQYDLDKHTTSRKLIELLLAKVSRHDPED